MRFYTTSDISRNRSLTPEGFLICRNVPIARTGEQIYHGSEVPVTPGTDGTVTIVRDEAEVFHPDTIASFEGKPFTLYHPEDAVTPENWSELSKGHAQNVRRGEGLEADTLLADILVMDRDTIDKLDDIREVSCGYDAEYEEIAPGRGRQTKIRGNHVALVEKGRCGSLCAIHDHKAKDGEAEIKALERKLAKLTPDAATCEICGEGPASKYGPAEATLCKECKAAFEGQKQQKDCATVDGYAELDEVNGHTIYDHGGYEITVESRDGTKMLKAFPYDEEKRGDYDRAVNEAERWASQSKDHEKGGLIMKVKDMVKALLPKLSKDEKKELAEEMQDEEGSVESRLSKIEDTLSELVKTDKEVHSGKDKKGKDAAFEGKETPEEEEEEKKKKESEAKDAAFMAKDAAPVLQEVLYRSSILAPDLTHPTTDAAKVPNRKTFDEACCLIKRKSLDAAFRTEDGKRAVEPFLRGATPDFFTADCAAVDAAFVGASEVMKALSAKDRAQHKTADFMRGGISVADINKTNAAFWTARKEGK